MKKIIVGLTGGVASGKTTVLKEFKKHGFEIINCDEISREVFYAPRVLNKIKKIFGTTDRKKIARMIFVDSRKKKKLESILHPPIIKSLRLSISRSRGSLVAAEVPLLFEKKLKKMFNISVVVWTPKRRQLNRLQNLGLSKTDALKRISAQMPLDVKCNLADEVIVNDGSMAQLRKNTTVLIKKILSGVMSKTI